MIDGNLSKGTLKVQATMAEIAAYGRECYEDGKKDAQSRLAEAWDDGWDALYTEHSRQAKDPNHPITRYNPYEEAVE